MSTKQLKELTKMLVYTMAVLLFMMPLVSCDSDDDDPETPTETPTEEVSQNDLIVVSRTEVDFGEVMANASSAKVETEDKVEIVTLTNNSNERLVGLESSINFPGKAAVQVTNFSGLNPGESIDVVFTFGPSNLGPGEYTGTASLTPSIGAPIIIALKASVVPASTTEEEVTQTDLISVSSKSVDFGQVKGNTSTAKGKVEDKEVVITVTNNSNERLIGLSGSINFPGNAAVRITNFSGLEPGESFDVVFTFGPSNLEPGEYTGTATLTPSLGDPITIDLRAEVI
jgi:hypothetical protein